MTTRRSVVAAARAVARPRAHTATARWPLALTLCWLFQGLASPQDAAAAGFRCPEQSAPTAISAVAVRACVERGGRINLHGKIVRDNLDLRGLQAVERPFACLGCRFQGDIDASEVIFRRTVDLTGSTIQGDVRMRGTLFQGAALFSGVGKQATFNGSVDFTLAVFGDILSFEDATFSRPVWFTSTRFLDTASFSLATFLADVFFGGAAFAGAARFGSAGAEEEAAEEAAEGAAVRLGARACAQTGSGRGAFEGRASFKRASFRSGVDFRQRCFGRRAGFAQTDFGERAEFTQAEFLGNVTFKDARLRDGATFRAAVFKKTATLEDVTSGGSLDFAVANFLGEANFFGLISENALVFEDAAFGKQIEMEEVSVASLLLDVEAANRVAGEEKGRVLQMIESAAKARGDLDRANDAHFERLSVASEEYGAVRRFWDIVFYRGLAGYLVRPAHPLIALFILAFLAALVRWSLVLRSSPVSESSGSSTTRRRRMRGGRRRAVLVWQHFRDFVREYWRTIRRTVRDRQDSEPDPQPLFLEVAVYRVLFVVAIIGLANSNPTLRQMVDAAF